jgi:hypothetical protein
MIEEAPIFFTNQNLLAGEKPQELELPLANMKVSFRNFIHDFSK